MRFWLGEAIMLDPAFGTVSSPLAAGAMAQDVGAGHDHAQHLEHTWGLQALEVVTKTIASSSASRQVAAAMIAAAIRTLSDCAQPNAQGCQVANAAWHHGINSLAPVSAIDSAKMKRLQGHRKAPSSTASSCTSATSLGPSLQKSSEQELADLRLEQSVASKKIEQEHAKVLAALQADRRSLEQELEKANMCTSSLADLRLEQSIAIKKIEQEHAKVLADLQAGRQSLEQELQKAKTCAKSTASHQGGGIYREAIRKYHEDHPQG